MGWGKSGNVNDPDAGIWDFHRGYNVVREYVSNKIRYGFEDPNNGGLELEAVANSGDSGGAATIELAMQALTQQGLFQIPGVGRTNLKQARAKSARPRRAPP